MEAPEPLVAHVTENCSGCEEGVEADEEGNAGEKQVVDEAIQFVDSLCRDLQSNAPPIVPELPHLRKVLQLSDDTLMVRPTDLVRKVLDELALGLHFHVLFTMVHSALLEFKTKKSSQHPRHKIRFRVTSRWNPTDGKMMRYRFPKDIQIDIGWKTIQKTKFMVLSNVEEYCESTSMDVRVLLGHIITVNSLFDEMWNFWFQGEKRTYYPPNSVAMARGIRSCANYFSHRDGVLPQQVPEVPSKDFFVDIAKRDAFVAYKFLAKVSQWCTALKDHGVNLVKSLLPRSRSMKLYQSGERWVYGFLRGLSKAAKTHFESAIGIVSVFDRVSPYFSMHTSGQLPTDLAEKLYDDIGALRDRVTQELEGGEPVLATRAQRFVLFMLWSRFGPVEKDTSDSDGWLNGSSGENGEESDAESVASYNSDHTFDSRASKGMDESEAHDFGLVNCSRFEIVDFPVPGMQAGLSFKIVQTKTTFKADPFGSTHMDMTNRIVDVTLLALRHILIQASRQYTATLYAPKQTQIEEAKLLQSYVVEEFLKLPAIRRDLELDKEAFTFLGTSVEEAEVAIMGEPTVSSSADPKMELFRSFARRPDVMERIRKGHWKKEDLIPHYVRFEPHFADPRFIAEFLRRLKHPWNGTQLFPEASEMINVRDRAMHQFNLVEPTHYRVEELYSDLINLTKLVKNVSQTIGIEEKAETLDEVIALYEMQELIGHYKRWRSRQQVAFSFTKSSDISSAVLTTMDMLQSSFDVGTGQLIRNVRLSAKTLDGSVKSLRLLLELYKDGVTTPSIKAGGSKQFNVMGYIDDEDEDFESEFEHGSFMSDASLPSPHRRPPLKDAESTDDEDEEEDDDSVRNAKRRSSPPPLLSSAKPKVASPSTF